MNRDSLRMGLLAVLLALSAGLTVVTLISVSGLSGAGSDWPTVLSWAVLAVVSWWFAWTVWRREGAEDLSRTGDEQPENAGSGSRDARSRYSVAVLPFTHFSTRKEDVVLADGLTEDLITALASVTSLSVAARNTSFGYKGRSPDIREVGRDLGVRYVVEGSLRRLNPGLRITAQLIESESGAHAWAQRYDRLDDDGEGALDELVESIAAAITSSMTTAELRRTRDSERSELEARDQSFMQLNYLAHPNQANLDSGIDGIQCVIEDHPDLYHAHAVRGLLHTMRALYLLSEDPAGDLEQARASLNRAGELAHSEPGVMRNRAVLVAMTGDAKLALNLSRQVLDQIPNSALSLNIHGTILVLLGRPDEALGYLAKSLSLAPNDPFAPHAMAMAAMGHLQLQQFDRCLDTVDEALDRIPELAPLHLARALACQALGRTDEALAAWQKLQQQAVLPGPQTLVDGLRWYRGGDTASGHMMDLVEALQRSELTEPETEAMPGTLRPISSGNAPVELTGYRLLDRLGEGGAGDVYLAEQRRPKRKVAVKLIAPDSLPAEFLRALKEEGDIAAQFEHDNLIMVIECGIEQGYYFLAMQYLSGGTLDARIGAMHPTEIVAVIRAIASGLGHIHGRGYVHRDVKPGNILFSQSGKPVLADFGIAKEAESIGDMTRAGYVTGTPAYMSPEQILGRSLDGRSDLYSLGVVFYECLTGTVPFRAEGDFELRKAHVESPAPLLPEELSSLQPVLDCLLAKRRQDRYPEASMLIEALDDLGELDQLDLAAAKHAPRDAETLPMTRPGQRDTR